MHKPKRIEGLGLGRQIVAGIAQQIVLVAGQEPVRTAEMEEGQQNGCTEGDDVGPGGIQSGQGLALGQVQGVPGAELITPEGSGDGLDLVRP